MKFVAFIAGMIATPLLFALAAALGWLPSDSTSVPPSWEVALGARALDTSLEKRSRELQNPIAANDSAALAAGRKIYAANCSGCHGNAIHASPWGSRNFYPRVPQFSQEGTDVDPAEAYAAVHDGIRYSGMAAWRDQLSEREMWQVANFVASVRSKPQRMERNR